MITEAIVLAGGLGTKIPGTIPELPKCMAPVGGRPFLFYVINYLRGEGIEKFIFSLGYKHEVIEKYLKEQFPTLQYESVIEGEPLGTGGAVRLACIKVTGEHVVIVNGDSFFEAELSNAFDFHLLHHAECTILLKPMSDFDNYSAVETDPEGCVINFKEKRQYQEGAINGGIYFLHLKQFYDHAFPWVFLFEKNYLEKFYTQGNIYGQVQDRHFIDIRIPADYDRAQKELPLQKLQLEDIDSSWTIFIDRDGVINHEKKDDYIRNKDEFRFFEGVPEALQILTQKTGHIIIISNQRGVGKGLMTEEDLLGIHHHMQAEIEKAGGRVDAIYYCTHSDPLFPQRKPNPGMARQAKQDFPVIAFPRSVMIGNKPSDMLFGRNAGMHTVFIASTHPETPFPNPDIDLRFNSLAEFAKSLPAGRKVYNHSQNFIIFPWF